MLGYLLGVVHGFAIGIAIEIETEIKVERGPKICNKDRPRQAMKVCKAMAKARRVRTKYD